MAPCMPLENCHSPSRTEKYKKVLKPLLERRRRARINSCLDDLKQLLTEMAELEGDSSRLEKADILEMAVTQLRRLKHSRLAVKQQKQTTSGPQSTPVADMTRYRAGFSAAATVVSRALASVPGVDVQLGSRVMQQLGLAYQALDEKRLVAPLSVAVPRFVTRVPVSSSSSCSSDYCVSPADSCSSGYSSGADCGLLTVARDSEVATSSPQLHSSHVSSTSLASCSSQRSQQCLTPDSQSSGTCSPHMSLDFSCQTSPLNLVAGEEDMWRPW